MKVVIVLAPFLFSLTYSAFASPERCLFPPQFCINPPNEPNTSPVYIETNTQKLTPLKSLPMVKKHGDKKTMSKKSITNEPIKIIKDLT